MGWRQINATGIWGRARSVKVGNVIESFMKDMDIEQVKGTPFERNKVRGKGI